MFADQYKSEQYKKSGHPSKADFTEFAGRIGVAESRVEKLISPFLEKHRFLETLINRSFLSDAGMKGTGPANNKKPMILVITG